MPPKLALTLCSLFVLFLLKLNRKQYPEASTALWIPTIWMLLAASKPLGVWFNAGGASMEMGSPLDRNFLSILAIIGIIILAKRGFNWSEAVNSNFWAILLLGFMFISTFWTDIITVSLKRWARELIVFIMAFVVSTEIDAKKSLMCLFQRIIYILLPFSYVLINYFPYLGREYGRWSGELMWIGMSSQKNGLATLCLFSILFIIWGFISKSKEALPPVVWYEKYVEIFIFLLSLWLFGGPNHTATYSATSTVALSVGVLLMAGSFWLKRMNIMLGANLMSILISTIIIFGIITPFAGGLFVSDLALTFNRDETLTGRSDIWAYLFPYAMNKPILGHGFGGFWTDAIREATSSHAHNGYLDVILNLGFWGLIQFSIYLISSCFRSVKMMNYDFRWGCLWTSLLFSAVVHNIAESTLTSFSSMLSATLLFLFVSENRIGFIKKSNISL